jgi:hypothetical protein
MSKLQRLTLVSQIMILGSSLWAVWLYASYLAHHRIWDNAISPSRWVNNPNYGFDWIAVVFIVVFFGSGLLGYHDAKRAGLKWHKSADSAIKFTDIGWIFLIPSGFISSYELLFWLTDRNNGHYNNLHIWIPGWSWSMPWSIVFGWSTVLAIFCFIQGRRLLPPKLIGKPGELTVLDRYKGIDTEDVVHLHDETFIVMAYRRASTSDPKEQKLLDVPLSYRRHQTSYDEQADLLSS